MIKDVSWIWSKYEKLQGKCPTHWYRRPELKTRGIRKEKEALNWLVLTKEDNSKWFGRRRGRQQGLWNRWGLNIETDDGKQGGIGPNLDWSRWQTDAPGYKTGLIYKENEWGEAWQHHFFRPIVMGPDVGRYIVEITNEERHDAYTFSDRD